MNNVDRREGEAGTEAEWLTATEAGPMLQHLRDRASEHELRLFACACCHRSEHFLLQEIAAHRAHQTVRPLLVG